MQYGRTGLGILFPHLFYACITSISTLWKIKKQRIFKKLGTKYLWQFSRQAMALYALVFIIVKNIYCLKCRFALLVHYIRFWDSSSLSSSCIRIHCTDNVCYYTEMCSKFLWNYLYGFCLSSGSDCQVMTGRHVHKNSWISANQNPKQNVLLVNKLPYRFWTEKFRTVMFRNFCILLFIPVPDF